MSFQELMETRSLEAKLIEKLATEENCVPNTAQFFKEYELRNNLWGQARLNNENGLLCTFRSENGVGWKWRMPENVKGVIGYPSLQFGPGPWRNAKDKSHGFPVKIKEIENFEVQYETEIYVQHQKYNLAFDVWLSTAFSSNENTVTTEIMVWEDYFDFNSYGKKVDEIITPFGVYELRSGYLKNDEYNQDWQYFGFIRKEKRIQGRVDLLYLLEYLVENQGVNPQEYVTSVEFGNEIGNSSGFTLIKKINLILD